MFLVMISDVRARVTATYSKFHSSGAILPETKEIFLDEPRPSAERGLRVRRDRGGFRTE